MRKRSTGYAGLAVAALCAGGCASTTGMAIVDPVEAVRANVEIPEAQLLDVGIETFDPGIEGLTAEQMEEQGIAADLRRSEARYMPYLLKQTLQSTGHWGAVREVPAGTVGIDLQVSGRILKSNGKDLELQIRAVDATGREWLNQKYEEPADTRAYLDERERAMAGIPEIDPYQNLYNRIANDLLAARQRLQVAELLEIRQVSRMRFAADLAPEPFAAYVQAKDERWNLERLPAEGDPMIQRIDRIRERDQLFVDTLNEHYATFFEKMDRPYDEWRSNSLDEQLALEEIQRSKKKSILVGAITAIAGIVAVATADNTQEDCTQGTARQRRECRDRVQNGGGNTVIGELGEAATIAGATLIYNGIEKGKEAEIHKAALKELADSLDAELDPVLVEVDGHTLRLAGSAETQFEEWRRLLRDMFAAETGLSADPNAVADAPVGEPQHP